MFANGTRASASVRSLGATAQTWLSISVGSQCPAVSTITPQQDTLRQALSAAPATSTALQWDLQRRLREQDRTSELVNASDQVPRLLGFLFPSD